MAVVVMAENPSLTKEMYEGMAEVLHPVMEQSPGFVAHAAWPTPEGWRIVEVWQTQQDANQFFAKHVHPLIPPGKGPKRTVIDVHALVEKPR